MKGHMDTELGQVIIDTDVIATYAGSIACECFGIVGMAAVSVTDGIVRLLKKDSLKHGITVKLDRNCISLDFHVILAYGISIETVAGNLFQTVKYQLEEFTGMKVENLRMIVDGVRVID